MAPEGSLRCSQETATVSYPEPDASSLHLPSFPKIHSHIILSSMPRFSEWSLPFNFSDRNFICTSHLSHECYTPCQHHLLHFVIIIIFGEVYNLWSSSCSLLQPPTTFSHLGPNIFLSILFSNTLNLCSGPSVRNMQLCDLFLYVIYTDSYYIKSVGYNLIFVIVK